MGLIEVVLDKADFHLGSVIVGFTEDGDNHYEEYYCGVVTWRLARRKA